MAEPTIRKLPIRRNPKRIKRLECIMCGNKNVSTQKIAYNCGRNACTKVICKDCSFKGVNALIRECAECRVTLCIFCTAWNSCTACFARADPLDSYCGSCDDALAECPLCENHTCANCRTLFGYDKNVKDYNGECRDCKVSVEEK